MNSIQTYTFWQLATQYDIEIPIIQRDYAQGRSDEKSKEVRTIFLSDLLSSLKDSKPVELDFVYGKVANKVFVPIDGQQRLSTLFLLHWYVAVRSGNVGEMKDISFSYKTRISARDFCKKLTCSSFDFDENNKDFLRYVQRKKIKETDKPKKHLSFTIKNASWFFLSWEKDPTVKAMLTMLDAIHIKFRGENFSDFWKKLTEPNYSLPVDNPKLNSLLAAIEQDENKSPKVQSSLKAIKKGPLVSFRFLNLEDFQLTNELYLKMNARGKPLSSFEKFKAWLIGFVEVKEYKIIEGSWVTKLDKDWADLLWKFKGEKREIDHYFMRFFVEMALFEYARISEKKEEDKRFIQNIQNLAFTEQRNINFYSNKYFEELNCFSAESLNFIFQVLNFLQIETEKANYEPKKLEKYISLDKLFRKLINNNIKYLERVKFYSLIVCISGEGIASEKLFDWMRIIRNLVENTTIDSPTTFEKAIKAVAILKEYRNDILVNLKDGKLDNVPFFKTQLKEERVKATLMLNENGPEWRSNIIEVENHPFFKGNIGFLLLQEGQSYDLEKFKLRKTVAMRLFDEEGVTIGKKRNLLGRVLLSLGLKLEKDELWLGGKNKQYWDEHLKDFHYQPFIVQAIDLMIEKPKEKYSEVLEEALKEVNYSDTLENWKKCLINNPKLFSDYSCYGRVIKNGRGINLYEREKFNANTNAILIENNRNEVISQLTREWNFKLQNPNCKKSSKFYAGEEIELNKEQLKLKFNKEKVKIFQLDDKLEELKFTDENNPIIEQLIAKFPAHFEISPEMKEVE